MKSRKEIAARIKSLLQAELDRRLAEAELRLPRRCRHNHQQVLDSRRHLEGDVNEGYNRVARHHLPILQPIGLCMMGSDNPEAWQGTICDDPIDAQRCPDFFALQSREEVVAEFRLQLETPEWVSEHLPSVASLLWAIEESPVLPTIPWWRRLWWWATPMRIEPAETHPLLVWDETQDE